MMIFRGLCGSQKSWGNQSKHCNQQYRKCWIRHTLMTMCAITCTLPTTPRSGMCWNSFSPSATTQLMCPTHRPFSLSFTMTKHACRMRKREALSVSPCMPWTTDWFWNSTHACKIIIWIVDSVPRSAHTTHLSDTGTKLDIRMRMSTRNAWLTSIPMETYSTIQGSCIEVYYYLHIKGEMQRGFGVLGFWGFGDFDWDGGRQFDVV